MTPHGNRPMMTPKEIVHELNKHIVGQQRAKRAVAVALRNRWRRQHVAEPLRSEIAPKNILMIGTDRRGQDRVSPAAWRGWPMHRSSRSKGTPNSPRSATSGAMSTRSSATWPTIAVKQTREASDAQGARAALEGQRAEERLLDVAAAAGTLIR